VGRKCKQCKEVELPPAAKCTEYIQKEGFCSSECKREFNKAKKEKAAARPKRAKKSSRKSVKISKADEYFSKCVRFAADNTCAVCGEKFDRTECSHIFSRRHRTIRWAKDNALCKCHTCHRWWHENPTESGSWFRSLVGEGFYQLLIERKNSKVRVTKLEEDEIAKHYQDQLKLMESGEQDDFESWQ
jgi:hypothetical protein